MYPTSGAIRANGANGQRHETGINTVFPSNGASARHDLKSAAAKAASRFDPGRPYLFPRTQSSGAGFPAKRSAIQATASSAEWKATRMWASSGIAL